MLLWIILFTQIVIETETARIWVQSNDIQVFYSREKGQKHSLKSDFSRCSGIGSEAVQDLFWSLEQSSVQHSTDG